MTLEYFKRDPEKWGIIGFLNECREEPFERKIDKYLKQLETIVINGRKNESRKAKKLIDKYRMEPKSDSKKAKKWNKERLRNIHVNKSTINNKFNYGNISSGLINCSTHVTDSNTLNAAEDIESVNAQDSIINNEQGKTHDLEKSWEFERPIPEWLERIHKHREDLTTTVDTTDLESFSQVAENAIWWRIIDASDPKLTEFITEQEFLSLRETLLSNLSTDWKVLEPPVERCLHFIEMLDKKGLKKVAKTVVYHGVCGAIRKIRKISATSNKTEEENPFLASPVTEITIFDDVIQDGDVDHPDKHDFAKDLTWGQEFSLCERAGSKIENGRKILDNTLKVQKTLRDMHETLLETLSQAGGGTVPVRVLKAFRKLVLPGFISSRFFIRVLLNVYIGGKYYGSNVLAEFDIPTRFDELGKIVTIARVMLNVKQTIKTFTLMKEASEKNKHSTENMLISQRIKEHVTPKVKKTNKENVTPKTKKAKRALELSNAHNIQ
ncbi:10196_t:CDS:2 [Cetraspora pellucida]|uniref:10196_t:CDS:1 n=1 Tax=Cetraspora pellucida TaxID=1433469 RepID=A0ACA9K6W0_9GLOM|nr:10196_t:CDS:2 [Cetraspora pellucida]